MLLRWDLHVSFSKLLFISLLSIPLWSFYFISFNFFYELSNENLELGESFKTDLSFTFIYLFIWNWALHIYTIDKIKVVVLRSNEKKKNHYFFCMWVKLCKIISVINSTLSDYSLIINSSFIPYSFLIFIFSFSIHSQQLYFSIKSITFTIFFAILSQES